MKFQIPSPLVLIYLICSILFFSSCDNDSDLFETIFVEQVDESEEVIDIQNEEESEDDENPDTQNEEEESEGVEDEGNNEEATDSGVGDDTRKLNIIFDTDANNELDDQHALAYLVSNGDIFNLEAVTINVTNTGGGIENHVAEAFRVLSMYNLQNTIGIYRGAESNFEAIEQNFDPNDFEGQGAVNQIIQRTRDKEISIVAVGKLTNIALAIRKDPTLVNRTKIIWLGSNYPNSGEFNLQNDAASVNFVIESGIPLEIVTVRLGTSLPGSSSVSITVDEINDRMPGLGPEATVPVSGRHGGQFRHFGDYSISLFANIGKDLRSLFDLVALSILKNPEWGDQQSIPAPILVNGDWVSRPGNSREVTIWGDFDRDGIIEDFFESLENYFLVQ